MGLHSAFWGAGEMAGMLSKGGVRKQNVTSCKKKKRNLEEKANSHIGSHFMNQKWFLHHL